MAKETPSLSKDERKALKAAKKEAKASKPEGITKPEKKDKKEKKDKSVLAERALKEIQNGNAAATTKREEASEDEDEDGRVEESEVKEKGRKSNGTMTVRPVGALVPFANPLADERVAKKVFKGVKKAAASRTLKRGVKEVVKALRKSTDPSNSPTVSSIVILAADISPMDVISHIPVLCEDHNVPYIYVASRAELGIAGQTKRPTSVVLLGREASGKGKGSEGEEWVAVFEGLVKVVQREGGRVKV